MPEEKEPDVTPPGPGGVEEPAPPEATPVDPIDFPPGEEFAKPAVPDAVTDPAPAAGEPAPAVASSPTPMQVEDRARAEALQAGLEIAEAEIAERQKELRKAQAHELEQRVQHLKELERRYADNPDSLSDAELYDLQATLTFSGFNVQHEIRRRALEMVTQWCIVDTPTGGPLRLNDKTTIAAADIGQWVKIDANEVQILRDMASMGHCTAIIRPPGWEPRAVPA